MTFIESAYGKQLCDMGNRLLGRLLKEKTQYAVKVDIDEVEQAIQFETEKNRNARYINSILLPATNERPKEKIILIFEKDK